MAICVELDDRIEPYALSLRQDIEDRGLSVAQIEYWEKVRQLELLVRQHFETDVANRTVLNLREIASEAFGRSEPSNVDLERFENFRASVVQMGTRVRNDKLWKKVLSLSKFAGFALFLIVIWILGIQYAPKISFYFSQFKPDVIPAINLIGVFGFGLLGLSLGAIGKSMFSNQVVSVSGLSNLDNYNFSALLYLVYLVTVFSLALVCFALGWFDFSVGAYSFSAVFNVPEWAFFLGVVCGFSETTILGKISDSMESRTKRL